jgi:hypothetical protein
MEAPLDEFEFAFEEEEEEVEEVGEGKATVASGVHRAHRATAEQKAEAKEQRRRARFCGVANTTQTEAEGAQRQARLHVGASAAGGDFIQQTCGVRRPGLCAENET